MALVIVLVLAIVVAAGGTGFAAGWFLSPRIPLAPAASASQADLQQRFQLFWEAWSVIDREFNRDGPIDLQKAVYGAISGAVQSLGDPYTAFSPPAQAKILAQDLEGCFEGIGATVDLVDGLLTVVQPLEGSPAFKAGLLSNDVVLEVDGTPLKGMDLTQAIALIRGPKGSQVRLLIRREGMAEPFEVVLTRERIDLPTVSYHMLDDGIAYVRLAEFNSQATVRLQAALGELMRNEPRALIFDLRGNPGGYLHIAVQVASQFMRDGLVVTEKDSQGEITEYRVDGKGLALDVPLVVLVDGGSASASEIVAGALQDTGRATLIGRTTFGKGCVQATYTLSDGSAVRVTIARWYTPKGRQLDSGGLEPDIAVSPDTESTETTQDPVLERAREFILSPQPATTP